MGCSVIVDGSARRFQAQKIHLRATAAVKWINRRNAILQGRKPQNGNIALLQQADNDLRNVSNSSLHITASPEQHRCQTNTVVEMYSIFSAFVPVH